MIRLKLSEGKHLWVNERHIAQVRPQTEGRCTVHMSQDGGGRSISVYEDAESIAMRCNRDIPAKVRT